MYDPYSPMTAAAAAGKAEAKKGTPMTGNKLPFRLSILGAELNSSWSILFSTNEQQYIRLAMYT